jgi:hypothetical protein
MTGDSKQRFVFDGRKRVVAAAKNEIRAEVERKYAAQFNSAGWFKRILLYFEMWREIKRRSDRAAPPDGLYFSAWPR